MINICKKYLDSLFEYSIDNQLLLITFSLMYVLVGCKTEKVVQMDYPMPFQFEIVDTISGNKNDVYIKGWQAMTMTYNSSKTVIDMQDKEAGIIIAKPITTWLRKSSNGGFYETRIEYVVRFEAKDGKYRIIVNNFTALVNTSYPINPNVRPVSYPDLNLVSLTYYSKTLQRNVTDKGYYKVKNYIMEWQSKFMSEFKKEMRRPAKDF